MGLSVEASYGDTRETGENVEARNNDALLKMMGVKPLDPAPAIAQHAPRLHQVMSEMRNVAVNNAQPRSASSCAEAHALGRLLHKLSGQGALAGDGIDWGGITFTMARESNGVRWEPCANCLSWLEKQGLDTYRLDRALLKRLNMRVGPVQPGGDVDTTSNYATMFPSLNAQTRK